MTFVGHQLKTAGGGHGHGTGHGGHGHHVRIATKRVWMDHHGNVRVALRCAAGGKRCTGTVRIQARHRTLGRAHFSLRAGHSKRVRVHLDRRGQRLVRQTGGLKAQIKAGGASRTVRLGLSH